MMKFFYTGNLSRPKKSLYCIFWHWVTVSVDLSDSDYISWVSSVGIICNFRP